MGHCQRLRLRFALHVNVNVDVGIDAKANVRWEEGFNLNRKIKVFTIQKVQKWPLNVSTLTQKRERSGRECGEAGEAAT